MSKLHPERLYPCKLGVIACVDVKHGGKPSLKVIRELGACGWEKNSKGEEVWNGFTHFLCGEDAP